ncbi:MAG TPA: CoA pyrophosphatase [Dongiaceae bacterium]|jgi:8-oxo-dGTP pyrophosphatase MutT (NUDIX family)|nr:CoA pyrophosphatase [Dongiaceae bacterium]
MERTLISQRFALAPAPGRRAAPGSATSIGAISGGVVAVPLQDDKSRRGDHDLNPDMLPTRTLVPAAVLVGLVERPEGMHVLLTKRTPHLNDHAGQISFPGGRVDASDADAIAAALREAEEEVGLPVSNVEMIGRLDTYVTRTGFEVTPCVGFVRPPELYLPDPFEVAEVFEVPLSFFRTRQSRKLESRMYQGKQRFFYAYPWGDYYIWGATAGMLNNLIEVLGHLDEA